MMTATAMMTAAVRDDDFDVLATLMSRDDCNDGEPKCWRSVMMVSCDEDERYW